MSENFIKCHIIYLMKESMDGGKWQGGGGVMNWEIGIDMYTLICIKWMTNKNLLFKKINK